MQEEHLSIIIELFKGFVEESYYKDKASYDPERTYDTIKQMINEPNGIALFDENTNAFFVGAVAEHWFIDFNYAFDYCIYVPKEHRGKGAGYKLLKAYVEKAKELGANEIFLGDIASIDQDTLFRMHEKLGLKYRSKSYSMLVGEE